MTAVVKSAQRAFAVLELFERERRPLSLAEVVALLGYPTSSAAALLKSLIVMGYLEYDRSSRLYGPTMRIVALGQWVRDRLFGDGTVLAAAQRLHAETGLTVVLAVQSDLHAQYLHLVHSGEPFRAGVTPGQLRPLASSGMGWLLLAAQPDREVRRLVRRINYAGIEARVDIAALLARLHEVRVRRYAFSRDGVSPGFGLIGAMMPPPESGRRLAIGVAGRTADLKARESDLAARLAAVIHRPGPAIPD